MAEGTPSKKAKLAYGEDLEKAAYYDATNQPVEMTTNMSERDETLDSRRDNESQIGFSSGMFGNDNIGVIIGDYFEDDSNVVSEVNVLEDQATKTAKSRKSFVLCDECLVKSGGRIRGNVLCLQCEVHLCSTCVNGHHSHERVFEKQVDDEEYDNQTREKQYESMVQRLMAERNKEIIIHKEQVHLQDRINVKHALDKDPCSIFGMCVLRNGNIVAADYANSALKLVNVKNASVARYIRLSSSPLDVAEVIQKHAFDKAGRSIQMVASHVAVTCESYHKILVLNFASRPVQTVKTIDVGDKCKSLVYHDDKYMVVCNGAAPCIKVLSTEGEMLNTINLSIDGHSLSKYLCIGLDVDRKTGNIYAFSDYDNAVLRINPHGHIMDTMKSDKIWPLGMSVDPASGVYVCSWQNDTVYRLSKDLKTMQPISEKKLNIKWPRNAVYHNDKLYISHGSAGLQNMLTVLRIE